MSMTQKRRFLIIPAIIWLFGIIIASLLPMVILSLATRGPYGKTVYVFTTDNFRHAFDILSLRTYWRTTWIATATTTICALLSYPVAYYLALRAPERWRRSLL